MKLDEKLRQVVAANDLRELRNCLDFMHFRLGWNYRQARDAAKKSIAGMTDDRWEELMRQVDDFGALEY